MGHERGTMFNQQTKFLTAEWRHLVMLNFEIDPRILDKRIPTGVELDLWNGQAYVSIVGFRFLNTKLLGIPIPFHRNFTEVNLRFYVRRQTGNEWRRGVVFIKEIVPLPTVTLVARQIYNENYITLPMRHQIHLSPAAGIGRISSSIHGNGEQRGWNWLLRWTGTQCPWSPDRKRNSLPNTTGGTPPSVTAERWNMVSNIRPGAFGEPHHINFIATSPLSMALNSRNTCPVHRSPPLSLTVLKLSSEKEFTLAELQR